MNNGYASLKETMKFLDVNKAEIENLVRANRLTAYKLGGEHIRFRRDQTVLLKQELALGKAEPAGVGAGAGLSQFWTFNGFYLVSGAVLSGLLFYFLKS